MTILKFVMAGIECESSTLINKHLSLQLRFTEFKGQNYVCAWEWGYNLHR